MLIEQYVAYILYTLFIVFNLLRNFERFIHNLKYLEEVGAAPVSSVKNSENGQFN